MHSSQLDHSDFRLQSTGIHYDPAIYHKPGTYRKLAMPCTDESWNIPISNINPLLSGNILEIWEAIHNLYLERSDVLL